jgi:exopolysaccharide biosynthesis protein
MNKQGKITLALALFYSVGLLGFVGYNLADTFLITHATSGEESETSETTTSATTSDSANSTSSGTSTSSTSTNTSVSSGSESSPYSSTSVSYSKKSAKNSDNVSTPYFVADIKLSTYSDLGGYCVKSSGAPATNATASFSSQISAVASERGKSVLCATNGDFAYYNSRGGLVIREGIMWRKTAQLTTATSSNNYGITSGQIFYTLTDGTAKVATQSEVTITGTLKGKGYINGEEVYNCWSFGPVLVNDSVVSVTSSDEVARATSNQMSQRTAIGYLGDHHFVLMSSEGRSGGNGFSLYELATIMKDYGCVYAYNLDGGGSSGFYASGSTKMSPDRNLGDIVYVISD